MVIEINKEEEYKEYLMSIYLDVIHGRNLVPKYIPVDLKFSKKIKFSNKYTYSNYFIISEVRRILRCHYCISNENLAKFDLRVSDILHIGHNKRYKIYIENKLVGYSNSSSFINACLIYKDKNGKPLMFDRDEYGKLLITDGTVSLYGKQYHKIPYNNNPNN